ncbi:MAG: hypothetical protein MUE55_08630 [Thermoplasmata archaeon]|nr:hypothetical protein [Thermoplasmata archaeon]
MARKALIIDGKECIDYEMKYEDEDRDRKIQAGVTAAEIYERTSAPDSRTYFRNPHYMMGGARFYSDRFHIRLPVIEALPTWAWIALLWSVAFFTIFVIVMILLMA